MKDCSHLYLDIKALRDRGWTETMVKRFLGPPDSWEPVNHWANFKGKKTYFLERVESVERSQDFANAFLKSARRLKLDEGKIREIIATRAATVEWVVKWRNLLTEDDIKRMRLLSEAAAIFEEARRRGYRTPHKA